MRQTGSTPYRVLAGLPGAALLLVLAACGNPFPEDQEMVQRAHGYLEDDRIDAAAYELRNALKKNPDNAEARYLLGNISLGFGDYATAAKEFRRAAMAGWDPGPTAAGLARSLLGTGNNRELLDEVPVVESYGAAVQADLHALRALALARLGDTDQAGRSLAVSAGLVADSRQLLLSTIRIHLAAGRIHAAEAVLEKALELYPEDRELLLVKAGILSAGGDTETVREMYSRIIGLDTGSFISIQGYHARLGLARLQLLAGELEVADATIKALYRRNRYDPETNFLQAVLAFDQGDITSAKARMFTVLERAPEHGPTQLLHATIKLKRRDYEQAAYYLSRYLTVNPDDISARILSGRTFLLLGETGESNKVLQRVMREQGWDVELLAQADSPESGDGHASPGRDAASVSRELALRSDLAWSDVVTGENGQVTRELTWLAENGAGNGRPGILPVIDRLHNDRYEQAAGLALDILGRDPDDPELLAMTGSVYAAGGNTAEARDYYTRALEARSDYLYATVMLAWLDEQAGNRVQAARLYRGLVDAGTLSAVPSLTMERPRQATGNHRRTGRLAG